MRGVLAIWRRELGAWSGSLGGRLAAVLFVVLLHAAFFLVGQPLGERRLPGLWEGRTASLGALFAWLPAAFVLLVPALSMGVWAEERRRGTEELLLSWPLRARDAVLGKFLAVWTALALLLVAAVAPLALVVSSLGPLDWGATAGGLAGAVLLAGSTTAIALCVSVVSGEQLVAFLLAALALGALWGASSFARVLPPVLAEAAWYLSPWSHYVESAARGLLDLSDLCYHALLIGAGLVLNTVLLRGRRWR